MESAPLKSATKPLVGLLINPLSGRNRKKATAISQTLTACPEVLQHEVQTPQDVQNALVKLGCQKVDLLVISGGDGTVQAVLTVLFNQQPFATQPQLMVLQGGTTNIIAGDVGVRGSQDEAIRRLLQWMETGRGNITRQQRPVLRLQVPGHEEKFGMFLGAANISQGIQYYHKNLHNKRFGGFPGICMTMGRFLWGIVRKQSNITAPTHITVRLDELSPRKEVYMLLFITTLERLFFGLRPFWGEESEPLHFTAVRSRAKHFMRLLPFLLRGRRDRKGTAENGYYSHNVKKVALYIEDSIALDGEMYTPKNKEKPTLVQHGGNITFFQV